MDENGRVTYSGTGTATFTAHLKYGRSREFTLTVTREEPPVPAAVYPDLEEIYLKPGEQSPFSISTDPSPAHILEYVYESEDESVVKAGEYGVLTAIAPGQAKVRVRAAVQTEDGEIIYLETYTTVIVSEESPEPVQIAYTISGDTAWTKGSGKDLTLTVHRDPDDAVCFDHFMGVSADSEQLEKDRDYTAVRGSTVITLQSDTLQALKAGTHTVTVLFDDGSTETEVLIRDSGSKGGGMPSSPDTSDHAGITFWSVLLGISALIFVSLLKFRRTAL